MLDLTVAENCLRATHEIDEVYGLAANMGGIGFIENNKAVIVRDNTLINLNTIEAARLSGVKRYLYTSSACIYPLHLQKETDVAPLKETDAYPADAEDGYGWKALHGKSLPSLHGRFGLTRASSGFITSLDRSGLTTAAREITGSDLSQSALANDGDEIEVWGDGEQRRSYCYIDDCVEGLYR